MKLGKIASTLGARLENGSPETEITGVAGIKEAGPAQITFVANPKYASAAKATKAGAVILAEDAPAIPGHAAEQESIPGFRPRHGVVPSAAPL